MTNKTFYVFRHGAVEERYRKCFRGRLDCALSDEGERASRAMARFLIDKQAEVVITTGRRRTDVVGKILARSGIAHIVDDRFQEVDFGEWEGKTWEEIEVEYPLEVPSYVKAPESFVFPSGEAVADVRARVISAWEDLLEKGYGRIGLVAHRLVIACLTTHLRGMRISQAEPLGMSELLRITMKEAAPRIERIEYDRDREGPGPFPLPPK